MDINVKCLMLVLERLPDPNMVEGNVYKAMLPDRLERSPECLPGAEKLSYQVLTFRKVRYRTGDNPKPTYEWELYI